MVRYTSSGRLLLCSVLFLCLLEERLAHGWLLSDVVGSHYTNAMKQTQTVELFRLIITPHAQRERGKVIGCDVHIYIYICLWMKKIFESYFRDRLTFSNIRSRTSRRIYRLALPLCALEMLSSLSKSRIPYLMRTLLYLSVG